MEVKVSLEWKEAGVPLATYYTTFSAPPRTHTHLGWGNNKNYISHEDPRLIRMKSAHVEEKEEGKQ